MERLTRSEGTRHEQQEEEEEAAGEGEALRALAAVCEVEEAPHRFAVRVICRLAALGDDARRQQWAVLAALEVGGLSKRIECRGRWECAIRWIGMSVGGGKVRWEAGLCVSCRLTRRISGRRRLAG